MRFVAVPVLAGVLGAALLASPAVAPGGELATRTIDLTLLCSTLTDAHGRRAVGIVASPFANKFSSPSLTLYAFGKTSDDNWPLVDLIAPGPRPRGGRPGLVINTRLCRTVEHSFAPSRAGLPGLPTELFAEERCSVGRRVLVRVRVTLSPWRGWLGRPPLAGPPRAPGLAIARGKPLLASMTVMTGDRPIAYGRLDTSGRTKLLTASRPRCGQA
jgi:hypothetical protein